MILWRPKAALALRVFVASATPFMLIKALAVTATANQQPELHSGADVGEAAPEFQLRRMDGITISLADFRGHPAVLIFWTSWCSFCKAEARQYLRRAVMAGSRTRYGARVAVYVIPTNGPFPFKFRQLAKGMSRSGA